MNSNLQALLTFIPPELHDRRMRPSYYPLVTTAILAANATVTLALSMQNVSAFLLTRITGRVWALASDAGVADPPFTVEFKFTSQEDLTNGATNWSSIVGTDANASQASGGVLEIPRLVPGGSSISAVLVNTSPAATSYFARLTLGGVNIFNN